MSIVQVSEQFQPNKQLLIKLTTTDGVSTSANILVSDLRTNRINLVNVQQGPQGNSGPTGPVGPAGKDGSTFDVLPISSGGTNNTTFGSGYLISYDGAKLSSSAYTIQDIIQLASANTNAITGIIEGSGIQKTSLPNNNLILDVKVGDGLTVTNNTIVVDNSIPRKAELTLGNIDGTVPISKGGTNNTSFQQNRLVYFDGSQIKSFPLATGQLVINGSKITIEAGSGLVGGGDVNLPGGSVLLQIGESADIFVQEDSISLSPTGTPGTYTRVATDSKGRVIAGSNLTAADILTILNFSPWHPGNDGSGSGLDADLLDGKQDSFFTNLANMTGVLSSARLGDIHTESKIGLKYRINTKGLIEEVLEADPQDVIDILGFTPLNSDTSDTLNGKLTITEGLSVIGGKVDFYDNLPLFGTNNPDLLPDAPRGFVFKYGGQTLNRSGIFAYYPVENQLKLITNVFSSSDVSEIDPNDPSFQDDVNGGNASTIFITENLLGNTPLTVLFREIADNLYVNLNQPQSINGFKEFLQDIGVFGQLRFLNTSVPRTLPAIDMGGNTKKIIDLNADLLDDQDGSYYRNATNITGTFLYDNVSFEHIDGLADYIPKFKNNNSIEPSEIKQNSDRTIEVLTRLSVGNNSIESGNNASLSAGLSNIIESDYSLAVGMSNVVLTNNSIALNEGSVASGKNSIAMGSYGRTYLENQVAFGAFATFDSEQTMMEQGQYSTVAAYLKGVETQGAWKPLSPVIKLPKDKTITFNAEILINKGLSSGVANFIFESGIINNATYRDPFNIINIINSTSIPSSGSKTEVFNNSQLRRHKHRLKFEDLSKPSDTPTETEIQHVWATDPPAQNLPVEFRYFKDFYFFNPEYVKITGTFEKNQTGSLILDIHKPRYYGNFTQNTLSNNNTFIIESTSKHEFTPGSLIDIHYTSGSVYCPPSGRYHVAFVPNDKTVLVNGYNWKATKYDYDSGTKLVIEKPNDFDQYFEFSFSGNINGASISNFSTTTNKYNYNFLETFDLIDKTIQIKYKHNNIDYIYNRTITGINLTNFSQTMLLNAPINNPEFNFIVYDSVGVSIKYLSAHLFKTCDYFLLNNQRFLISGHKQNNNILFETYNTANLVNDSGISDPSIPEQSGLVNAQNKGIVYELDSYQNNSFSILFPNRITSLFNGQTVDISPFFNQNTGSVNFYSKNNFDCVYESSLSSLNQNTGVYTRYIDGDRDQIRIYDTSYNEIDFVSSPVAFSFVDGPFSENNHLFKIIQKDNRYYLYTNTNLNAKDYSVVPIRLKCTPSNTTLAAPYEEILYVTVLPSIDRSPVTNTILEPIKAQTDDLFEYILPSNLFNDFDQHSLTYAAYLSNSDILPEWLTFNPDTLAFSGYPNKCDIGVYSIEIKATDPTSLYAVNYLLLEVYENKSSILEHADPQVANQLKIQNIYLTNNKITENFTKTLVGEILHQGGYNPYIIFGEGHNSTSGVFIQNSNMFRYAQPIIKNFSGITAVSGSPAFFGIDTKVTANKLDNQPIQLGDDTRVTHVFTPTIISGTPIDSNKIYFDNIYIPWSGFAVFANQYISEFQLTENFGSSIRTSIIDDYSILISNGLLQETSALILTEDNDVIDHDYDPPKTKPHSYPSVAWSKKRLFHKLYDELENYTIADECNDSIISDNPSTYKQIEHSATKLNILLVSENNEYLTDEYSGSRFSGMIYDERIWSSDEPIVVKKAHRQNVNYHTLNKNLDIKLKYLNKPNFVSNIMQETDNKILAEDTDILSNTTSQELNISNIDYVRDNLLAPKDSWLFENINNAVLYVNNLGNNNVCKLISEDRSYSGYFYEDDPFEFAILATEDNLSLRPETDKYNGSIINVSSRYEIIEQHNLYANNSYMIDDTGFTQIICENEDKLVNNYIFNAQQAEAYILFPGDNDQIDLYYPRQVSYSKQYIQAILPNFNNLGYYENNLTLRPIELNFTQSDFYYTWGKLIPYRFSTDEYAIRLDHKFTQQSTTGLLKYSGIAPYDNHYYPEKVLYSNKITTTGYCPEELITTYQNGLDAYIPKNNQHYVTGTVTFFTSYAANDIIITSLNKDINKDIRFEDTVYLYDSSSVTNNALLPSTNTYKNIFDVGVAQLSVRNFFLYPSDKVVNHSGAISLNLDRNHSQILKSPDIVNFIPIKFNSVFNYANPIRMPKDGIFPIKNISGQKIFTTDNKNYLLRSDKYFEGAISGNYLTNGISFIGSLFNNNSSIYDVRIDNNKWLPIHKNISFQYDANDQTLSLSIPSGLVRPFDNIILNRFSPLAAYMKWDASKTYTTGFKVFEENFSKPSIDNTDKDYVLLERSSIDLQPVNFVKLNFNTNIFANSVSGFCTIDINLSNRLEKGYLLNYLESTYSSGHQYIDSRPGYVFNGFIPKNHNIISSTGIINDDRIGFSSVFHTGTLSFMGGVKTARVAKPSDIGYTEYYHIGASGFEQDSLSRYSGMNGIGSSNLWYTCDIDTSGSNKTLEFLYLGHNTNTIKFFGHVKTANTNTFQIYKLSIEEQLEIERLKRVGINSGVAPVLSTGTNRQSGYFDISTNVKRFDLIVLQLSSSDNFTDTELSYLKLNSHATQTASPLPLILDSADTINSDTITYPVYTNNNQNLFYILPTFNTSLKYCNNKNKYLKNTNIYYNGNLIKLNNFSSINSYAVFNDQLKIEKLNNNSVPSGYCRYIQTINNADNAQNDPLNEERLVITGVAIDGPVSIPSSTYDYAYDSLREYSDRNVLSFGTGQGYLNHTGQILFTYNYSGTFDLINYNNIYTQTYGGYTSRWPQDIDGVLTDPPITGVYRIVPKDTACSSGKLCILIDGYLNNSLNSLRLDKNYFFDFDNYAYELSNTYPIFDRISPSTISISTPYLSRYQGLSGIVYIISSPYNIKTHLDPNRDNTFLLDDKPYYVTSTSLIKHQINFYDHDTKKWNNLYHISNDLPIYSGYPITINNEKSYILYDNKLPIKINKLNSLDSSEIQNITIYKSNSILENNTILISTINGSPCFTGNLPQDAPKIFVSGLSSYQSLISLEDQFFKYIPNSGWNMGLIVNPLLKSGDYNTSIIARDETGESIKNLTISVRDKPTITQMHPAVYVENTNSPWSAFFHLDGILIDDFVNLSVDNTAYPINNSEIQTFGATISNNIMKIFNTSIPIPESTNLWEPEIILGRNGSSIATTIAKIQIGPPSYVPVISNLKPEYFFNADDTNKKIILYVPVHKHSANDSLTVSVNDSIIKTAQYVGNIQSYVIELLIPNTDTGLLSVPLSFSLNQEGTSTVSEEFIFNVIIYKPLIINQNHNISTNNAFNMSQSWSYEFEVLEGATKHKARVFDHPRVKVINTPTYGNNNNEHLSYRIKYSRNNANNSWIVSILGLKDQYGRFAPNPGSYNMQLFVDDTYVSSATAFFDINYEFNKNIIFVEPNVYATPNNEFFINADITDINNNNTNRITFDHIDNSLNIADKDKAFKYNKYLNIWEYYATGNKLQDKWDSRISIRSDSDNSPILTFECKGIATDKITAVAKINLLELRNNNKDIIDGLPIKITGVKGGVSLGGTGGGQDPSEEELTPESGLIVEQGYSWKLKFKTKFGLESELYPPTIILSGENILATCSGYYPVLEGTGTDQNICLETNPPLWVEAEKAWSFTFSGEPSCTLSGIYDFSIIAIDTNLNEDPIYDEKSKDKYENIFTYIPIRDPHPGPQIVFDLADDETDSLEVEPFCGRYFNRYKFGPRTRELCPVPTGLKSYVTGGQLPPGLTANIEYTHPNPLVSDIFNAPTYDNLTSGTLTIQGTFTTYPTGEFYDEIFTIDVTDARDNTSGIGIDFKLKINALDPNVYTKLYFENHLPVFSPKTGTNIIGGAAYIVQPDAFPDELNCKSRLPKDKIKNCTKFPVIFSGYNLVNSPSPTVALYPYYPDDDEYQDKFNKLKNNTLIYFRSIDSRLPESYASSYTVKISEDKPDFIPLNIPYINLTNNPTDNFIGSGELVVREEKSTKSMTNLPSLLGGNPTLTMPDRCFLGNGKLITSNAGQGIGGLLSPSFSGYMTSSNDIFDINDNFTTRLKYNRLESSDFDLYGELQYIACSETGYFRVSGIALPPLYIETNDILNVTADTTNQSIAPRLAFGNTSQARSTSANSRLRKTQYTLTNLVKNKIITSGIVDVNGNIINAISLVDQIHSSGSFGEGAVYELLLESPSVDIFPTFNPKALPRAIPSRSYWPHRTGNSEEDPTMTGCPPIVIAEPKTISVVSGVTIDGDAGSGILSLGVGGYVPSFNFDNNQNTILKPNYSATGNNLWTSTNYPPIISGFIVRPLESIQNTINALGYYRDEKIYIADPDNLSFGDALRVTTKQKNYNTIIESFDIVLSETNTQRVTLSDNDQIAFGFSQASATELLLDPQKIFLYNSYSSLDITYQHQNKITKNINSLIISNKNNLPVELNQIIILDKINTKISTITHALTNSSASLKVTAIDSDNITAEAINDSITNILGNNFIDNDIVNLLELIEDNIKTMYITTPSIEGKWPFYITGLPNILYGSYTYRIVTKENKDMPIFDVEGWSPKVWYTDIPLIVNKSIKINSVIPNWSGSSWTVALRIGEGSSPALSDYIDVKIKVENDDWSYCGFNRFPDRVDKDTYDESTGETIITLTSTNAIDWSSTSISSFQIRVEDSTGTDTTTIHEVP